MEEHLNTKVTKGTKVSLFSFVYFVSFVFNSLSCGNTTVSLSERLH